MGPAAQEVEILLIEAQSKATVAERMAIQPRLVEALTALGDKVPGVWAGVDLHEHAARSQIDHLVVEFAGDESNEAVKVDASRYSPNRERVP